ncbi:MAG: hypothetical protein JWP89_3865 [Schlesneria sp.]|nr:hypothetical protein [Schlesneria sp.]
MPIKFRCNFCRQFLGISRAQAGGIVDCPTCGRSIRVPLLDGSLPPLPQPELNLQDTQLTRALDELARLANPDSSPVAVTFETAVDEDEEDENEIPQLIPEPIPIEVPIPPTPIAINQPMQDDEESDSLETLQDHSVQTPSLKYDVLAELAAVAPVDAELNPRKPAPARLMESRPQRDLGSLPRTLLFVAIAFVGGMLFERFVKVFESRGPVSTNTTAVEPGDAKPNPVSQVTGRITYKSADGTSQPDRGARVIAFPIQREGEAKLSVIGFRPADGEVDAYVASATLHAMGGALATADEAGQFRLELPAGTYQLLILSHFQSGDEKQTLDPPLQKLLAAYFDKPDDVLGRVKYDFSPLRVKGTGDVRDQSF